MLQNMQFLTFMCFYHNMGSNSISTNYLEKIRQTTGAQPVKTQANTQTRPQIDKLPATTKDYNINVPISYQKIKDINLPYDLKASCYKLSNGQNVIIVPKEGTTVVKTFVKTGSMNEPDNLRGISHYIEHNLFNGSEGLNAGEFFDKVNDMGAETNASTGFAETNYFISSNLLKANDLEEKIKLHASMLQTPRFAVDMLEKEKGIVNSEINMILSAPDNIAFNKVIKNLYNIKSTSKDMIGGTTDNITNLTREDVVNYFNKNYYPANMTTVITGEVNPDETMKLVSKYMNSQKQPVQNRHYEEMKPIQTAIREDLISDKAYSTGIYVGFNGPENCDMKGQVLVQALSKLLTDSKNSRISSAVRPLSTDVFMQAETVSTKPKDGIAIVFCADTTEEKSAQVLKIIANKLDELQYKLPTEAEMNWIKKSLKNDFADRFERSSNINDLIGETSLDGILDGINDYEKMVDSLTGQDISNAAKKYLDTSKASLVLIHPENVSEDEIKKNHAAAKNITFTGSVANTENRQKKAINMNNVKSYKLANNIQVLTNDIKTNNCKSLFVLNTKFPPNVNPVTSILLDKILNSGSAFKDETQFLSNLEKDDILLNFHAGDNYINATSAFSSEDTIKTLREMMEVIDNPRFTQNSFNLAKSQLEETIKKSEKNPIEQFNKELFPNENYGATKQDILEGLKTVTLEDVKGLYQYIIENSSATMSISAPFSKRPELLKTVFNELGQIKSKKEFSPSILDNYKPIEKTKVLTDTHNDFQADIIEGFKFQNNGNLKDDVTVMLMNIILGGNASSRLFNDLREKQKLAYSVRSRVSYLENTGILKLRIGTTTENKFTNEISYDNVQKAIDGFNKHIQKMKQEKVTDKELESAKLYLKNSVLSSNESTRGKTTSLSSGLRDFYGPNKDNMLLEMIDKITADDILQAANKIFSTKPIYSINATQNTLDANKEYFEKLCV